MSKFLDETGLGVLVKLIKKYVNDNAASVTVDDTLSSTSTNPVQNKVINTALAGKLSTSGGTMTGRIISTADTALFVPLSKVGITFYRDSNPNTIVGNLTAANYSGTAARATSAFMHAKIPASRRSLWAR